ncbi:MULTISPECIES: DNA primase [Thiorhodovibrio]|uniref:DNA primase n=1 Tax=Thiorhodovibrio TaxID=61593 RepID=UPI00191285FF|nr:MULTISPECIES: DNA primase [Thiorhodovibrio]MBK5969942.1 DNA primase [Thiorhodovibrio winogradskyi]WPL12864.1 DNA primase [Thiorhodovibrio litoralis]
MAGRIPPELKEQILARTDIVEIVGARVPLRPAGQLYKACCPFHQEKTPSFIVTPGRQSYHCFGCGVHGDAISFLMEYDRMNFPEAIEELASRAGIALPEAGATGEPDTPAPDLSPLYQVLEDAAALYCAQLREDPRAIAYLKERGLTGEIAMEFGLGFAPQGWDFLLSRLGRDSARQQALIDAGLVIEREKDGETRRYDRFRNRIMFPIRDRRGRVIAFGGRVLDQSEPKYLNSPETPVYHKGGELYGLFEARERQRQLSRLLIVEGYMDVIALTQFGLPYAVATLGTATTADQVQRLKRQADELIYCFDGDKAGRAAAWKALRVSLPFAAERLTLRFLLLPPGHDPDSLLRAEGLDAFETRLAQAQLLSDFLFDALREHSDLNSAEGRARCDAEARELIALAPEGTYRKLLLQQLEGLIGIRNPAIVPSPAAKAPSGWRARPPRAAPVRGRLTAVRLASALLLQRPRLALAAREIPEQWTELDEDGMELLNEILAHADADPDMTPEMLRECFRDSEHEPFVTELEGPHLTQHIPETGMELEFVGALSALCREAERERRFRMLSSGQLGGLAGASSAVTAMNHTPKSRETSNQGG